MGRGANNLLYGTPITAQETSIEQYKRFIDQLNNFRSLNSQFSSSVNWLNQTEQISELHSFLLRQYPSELDFQNRNVRKLYQLFVDGMSQSFPGPRDLNIINRSINSDPNKLSKSSRCSLVSWNNYQKLFPELLRVKRHLSDEDQKKIDYQITIASQKLPLFLTEIKQLRNSELLIQDLYNQYALLPKVKTLLEPKSKQTKQVRHYLIDDPGTKYHSTRLCMPGIEYDKSKWLITGKDTQLKETARQAAFISPVPVCDKCDKISKQKNNKYKLVEHDLIRGAFHILTIKQSTPFMIDILSANNPPPLIEAIQMAREKWLIDSLIRNLPDQVKNIQANRSSILSLPKLSSAHLKLDDLLYQLDLNLEDVDANQYL
jgi:hypothetical protein